MSPVGKPNPLLLITDNTETCERIASALLSAPVYYRVERLTTAELLKNGPPPDIAVALVDHGVGSPSQAEVIRRLAKSQISSVALVDTGDMPALQEVILAGTIWLVATPFSDAELWEAVGTAFGHGSAPGTPETGQGGFQPRPQAEGMIIGLYGPKGGSGTSVISANLAVVLQERSPKGAVLVEIGEATGSQAVLLNLRPELTLGDLIVRFSPSDTELISSALATHASGLKVLLAPTTSGVSIPMDFLDDLLEALQHMFAFVLLDLSATAQTSSISALRKADSALVILQPELPALHYGRLFINTAEAALPEVRLNIVLNRSTMPGGVPSDAIRRHLKTQTAIEIPDDPGLVTSSVNRGVPFVISHPRSGVARAIQKLAREVTQEDSVGLSHRLVQLAQNPFGRHRETLQTPGSGPETPEPRG